MQAPRTSRPRALALRSLPAVLGLLVLGACVAPQTVDPIDSTGYLPGSGLDALQPADIGVLPVIVRMEQEAADVPVEGLREALYRGLVDRLYSPLPLEWVDGGGDTDANLRVLVLGWDTSALAYDGTLVARVEASMRRAGDVLWAVELTRRLNADVGGAARSDRALALASSTEQLAREILLLLPERDPLAAR